jgi:uncharacterized protein YggE
MQFLLTESDMPTPTRVTAAIVLGTSLFCMSLPLLADTPSPAPGQLSVSAYGEVSVTPDKATLSASLWEKTPPIPVDHAEQRDPKTMQEARANLEARVAQLVTALEAEGIESERISAGSMIVAQEHSFGEVLRHNNERERLVRTRVERPIQVELHDLDRVPFVLDALTAAGVDRLGGVGYALQNAEQAEQDALAMAIATAKAEAQVIADGLGETLDRVLSVSKSGRSGPMPYAQPEMLMNQSMARSSGKAESSNSEYRSGQITVSANVDVRWLLELDDAGHERSHLNGKASKLSAMGK